MNCSGEVASQASGAAGDPDACSYLTSGWLTPNWSVQEWISYLSDPRYEYTRDDWDGGFDPERIEVLNRSEHFNTAILGGK